MHDSIDYLQLARDIRAWGHELGFADIGISGIALEQAEEELLRWLGKGYHGDMDYMAAHGTRRSRPGELVPGTVSVVAARLPYWPADAAPAGDILNDPALAYVSRYALGRDYHKVLRDRLQKLAARIEAEVGPFVYRAFTDSAPVMEVALAAQTKLGWRGKHTLLLNREAGSYFFLGEIYVGLPLPPDEAASAHCGTCTACLDACPTRAFVAPYVLDARRCISYLTIEHKGSIPVELRPLIGNRIYGCDDCQLACPWNREAAPGTLADFSPRHGLDATSLIELFAWDEETFLERMQGSAIRRIGHERWLRNIAVALGNALGSMQRNAPATQETIAALEARRQHPSELVREHVAWAIARLQTGLAERNSSRA